MINKVILIGNIGRDPEVRYLGSGQAVANFSVATTEKWKSASGEPQSKTEWHNITAFGPVAEFIGKYAQKGARVYIEGRLSYSQYEKEGVTFNRTSIVVREFKKLSFDDNGGSQHNSYDSGNDVPF